MSVHQEEGCRLVAYVRGVLCVRRGFSLAMYIQERWIVYIRYSLSVCEKGFLRFNSTARVTV